MSRPFRIPKMANVHSHAFQRALRGVGERRAAQRAAGEDFWGWREAMYRLAAELDPPRMREIARRAYTEMAAAGYGTVGEFHYVHHRPDGTPYEEPNEMAIVLAETALQCGLEIVLLPAAYHRAGWDRGELPASAAQRRFCDPTVELFLERVQQLRDWARARDGVNVGVAAHSVRAVPAPWLGEIAAYAREHGLVLHVHAHEQPRELAECQAEHGCSPIELLARSDFLGPRTTVVHAIHVSERDVDLLAGSGATVASCPTTEGDLGDGLFPALHYRDAGVPIAIGSDSQVVIDPFLEIRELETLARRERHTRNALLAVSGDLWSAVAEAGLVSLGLGDRGGRVGAAELAVDLDHPLLAGVQERDAPLAIATCASAAVVIA
jgi:formimidoylglutamate deiminase